MGNKNSDCSRNLGLAADGDGDADADDNGDDDDDVDDSDGKAVTGHLQSSLNFVVSGWIKN